MTTAELITDDALLAEIFAKYQAQGSGLMTAPLRPWEAKRLYPHLLPSEAPGTIELPIITNKIHTAASEEWAERHRRREPRGGWRRHDGGWRRHDVETTVEGIPAPWTVRHHVAWRVATIDQLPLGIMPDGYEFWDAVSTSGLRSVSRTSAKIALRNGRRRMKNAQRREGVR